MGDHPYTEADYIDQSTSYTAYGSAPASKPVYTIFVQRNDKASIKWKSKAVQKALSGVSELELG